MKFTFETTDAALAAKISSIVADTTTSSSVDTTAATTVADTTAASVDTTAATSSSVDTTAATSVDTSSTDTTVEDFKSAAKKAKRAHGEEFCLEVMAANGHNVTTTLGRECGKVSAELYDAIIAGWVSGPTAVEIEAEAPQEIDEELDEETLQEASTIDPDTVKSKLRDYARENGRDAAKALLEKAGLKTLGEIDGAAGSSLKTIMDAIDGGADEEDLDDF